MKTAKNATSKKPVRKVDSFASVWRSVSVNGNWRLTFAFENGDAILVDYQDYH